MHNIYVISLKNSPRRKPIELKFYQHSLKFEFIDAISTQDESFSDLDRRNSKKTFYRKGYSLLDTESACYASHLKMWHYCININKPIIIMEDNVKLHPGINNTLEEASTIISKYGYLKLSHIKEKKFISIKKLFNNITIGYYDKPTAGTTAYMITPNAAKKFIDNSEEFIEPVDDYMEKPWRHNVQAYSISPSPCCRDNIKSEIGKKRKNRSNQTFFHKIISEIFRIYESIKRKMTWHC